MDKRLISRNARIRDYTRIKVMITIWLYSIIKLETLRSSITKEYSTIKSKFHKKLHKWKYSREKTIFMNIIAKEKINI